MGSSAQIERLAAAWLARRDAGAWSSHDQTQLDAWLAASTAHRVAFLRLEAAWRRADRLKALGAGRADPSPPARGGWVFSRFDAVPRTDALPRRTMAPPAAVDRTGYRPAARRRYGMYGALAAVAGMALAAWLWPARQAPERAAPAIYATDTGALRAVPLADGSRITLSSDSRVAVSYGHGERHIELQRGEAFFEVAKDPSRPFAVVADGHRVVAVGTRFDVRRDMADLRVVVTQGVVRMETDARPDGRRQPITLLPAGSMALASGEGITVQAGSVAQAEDALSWRNGFLVFHDTPLAAAAAEFNRYNARKILVADASAARLQVGGHFRWSNADAFVRLLQQGFPVRVEHRGDTIVLHHR